MAAVAGGDRPHGKSDGADPPAAAGPAATLAGAEAIEEAIIATVLLGTEVAVAGEDIQGVVTVDTEQPAAVRVIGNGTDLPRAARRATAAIEEEIGERRREDNKDAPPPYREEVAAVPRQTTHTCHPIRVLATMSLEGSSRWKRNRVSTNPARSVVPIVRTQSRGRNRNRTLSKVCFLPVCPGRKS